MNDSAPDLVTTRIERRIQSMSTSEARVARYIEAHPGQVLLLSAAQLAKNTSTSDTTVVRASRSLGYSGWPDLRRALGAQLTLRTHPTVRLATRLKVTTNESTAGLLETVFEEARDRLALSREDIDPVEFDRAVTSLLEARTVHVYGVGLSSSCASYFARKLTRQGLTANELTGMGFHFADDLLSLTEGDTLIVFAPGRTFRELDVAFSEAARAMVRTILITGRHRHEYDNQTDSVIRVAGSAGGLTGETLSALVAADALLLALAQRTPSATHSSSKRLNHLRRELQRRPSAPSSQ